MHKIIFRYISKELYSTLLGIMMVLLIIFMSNQFVHFLRFAASGHITMTAVMELMSFQVPFLLAYLLPLALYLGILIVFGRLYLDHEMTVLSACGVSPFYLLGIVLTIGAVVTGIVFILMIWIQPMLDNLRVKIFYESAARATVEKVMPKRFQSLGLDTVLYAEEIERGKLKMTDIFFAHRQKPKANEIAPWDIIVAKTSNEFYQNNNQFILFNNGYRYLGSPGFADYQVIQYADYAMRLSPPSVARSGWPSNASTASLWHQRTNPKAAAELHWRLAMPISAFILSVVAFPLSRINPRRGKFSQLIPAILLYIVYGNLIFLGRAWIRKGIVSFSLGLWWIHGAILLIGIVLLFYNWKKGLQR